jgi:hypothetical protein
MNLQQNSDGFKKAGKLITAGIDGCYMLEFKI